MSIFLPNFWLYLPILFCAFITTYTTGRFLLRYIPEAASKTNDFSNVFVSLVLGFIVLVSIFAIIWTRGNSIMLLSAVIFGFYFLFLKDKNQLLEFNFKIKKREAKYLIYSAFIFTGISAIAYLVCFVRVNGDVFPDYPFYANVSYYLVSSHIESSQFISQSQMAEFYHWGELWFNSLWAGLFGLNHYYALMLITYPFFAALTVLGAVSAVKNILPYKDFVCVLIGLILLVFVPVFSSFVQLGAVSQHPKYFIIAVFIIWYFLSIMEEKLHIAALAMLLIIPFQTVMAPGCLVLLLISIAYFNYKNTKNIKSVFFNKYVLASFVMSVLFVLFYVIQPFIFNDNNFAAENVQNEISKPILQILSFFVKQSAFFIVRFLPVSLILFILYKKTEQNREKIKQISGMLVCVLISGLAAIFVGAVVRLFILDGRQIGVNYALIITDIYLFITLIYCLSFIKPKWTWLLLPLTCFYFGMSAVDSNRYGIYGKKIPADEGKTLFYQQVKDSFNKNKGQINFGYYRNYEGTEAGDWSRRLSFMVPLYRMTHIAPFGFYAPYCLSALDIPSDTKSLIDEREQYQIYKFIIIQKRNNSFISNEESILEFIEQRGINYIIIEKRAVLPYYLEKNTELIANYDGYQVYKVLNNEK